MTLVWKQRGSFFFLIDPKIRGFTQRNTMNIRYDNGVFCRAYVNHFRFPGKTVLCFGESADSTSLGSPRDGAARSATKRSKRWKKPCPELAVLPGGDTPVPAQVIEEVQANQRCRIVFITLRDAHAYRGRLRDVWGNPTVEHPPKHIVAVHPDQA